MFFEACCYMGFPRNDDLQHVGTTKMQTVLSKCYILILGEGGGGGDESNHTAPHLFLAHVLI